MTSEELLERLDELEAKATRAPWRGFAEPVTSCRALQPRAKYTGLSLSIDDVNLLWKLRNAYPDLARRLRIADEALEKIAAEHEDQARAWGRRRGRSWKLKIPREVGALRPCRPRRDREGGLR